LSWLQLLSLPKCTLSVNLSSLKSKLLTRKEKKRNSDAEEERIRSNLTSFLDGKWVFLWYDAVSLSRSVGLSKRSSKDWQSAVISRAELGNLGSAFAALDSSAVADVNSETIAKLQALHPPSAGPDLLSDPSFKRTVSPESFIVDPKDVERAIFSFPKGTAAGPDGLKVQHLLDVLRVCSAGGDVDPRPSLARLSSLLLSGKAPMEVAPFLGGARLVPLQKPDGGIRPIAVGCTWRRLAAKVLIRLFNSEFRKFFEPLQLGVGTSKGAEAIIHTTKRLIDLQKNNLDFVIFQADFHNAFNLIDRSTFITKVRENFPSLAPFVEWCYSRPSKLFVPSVGSGEAECIMSVNGTQQGDPLGPFLFSIALQSLIMLISKKYPNLSLNVWYMDDGTIAGSKNDISGVIDLILQLGPSLGLKLNLKKSVIYSPSNSPFDDTLFSKDIGRANGGITTLGCPLGSPEYLSAFFEKKLSKIISPLGKLHVLRNPQIALTILLKCVSFCKFSFFIRTMSPLYFAHFCSSFDSLILGTFVKIIGAPLGDLSHIQATLPIAVGGLGLRSTLLHGPAAYISSFNGVQNLMLKLVPSIDKSILCDESVLSFSKQLLMSNADPSSDFNLLSHSTSQKVVSKAIDDHNYKQFLSKCNTVDKARVLALQDSPQGLLFDVPLAKVRGFTLSAHELRFLICSRLGIPKLCNDGDKCFLCQSPMDSSGYHMAVCQKAGSFVLRHNALRDIIYSFCQKAALSPILESHCFPSSPGLRADIFLRSGRDICIGGVALDVTVIHPLQESILLKASKAPLQGCLHGESVKHKKYEGVCQSEDILLIPLAVEFFGCWGKEATDFFDHIAKDVACRFNNSKAEVLLQLHRQLSICLVRCNAKAVLKRISA